MTVGRLLPYGCIAAILFAGAVAMLSGGVALPAAAQSAGSAIYQLMAGTLPPGTSRVKDDGTAPRDQPSGQVALPNVIQSSTDVMRSEGAVQGEGGGTYPVKHLPKDMR